MTECSIHILSAYIHKVIRFAVDMLHSNDTWTTLELHSNE